MWKTVEHTYHFSRHLIAFLQSSPFYAEISRQIHKRFTLDTSTAAVTYDKQSDEVMMWVNPVWMGGGSYKLPNGEEIECKKLLNSETRGVILHEFDHIIGGHLTSRRREPSDIDNIAKDLAINSLQFERYAQSVKATEDDGITIGRCLPECGLIPGQQPYVDPKRLGELTPERRLAVEHLGALIKGFPPLKASEWYFHQLMKDREKNPDMYPKEVLYVLGPMDDHEKWSEDVSDETRENIAGRLHAIVKNAVNKADGQSGGWGDIPEEYRSMIRKSVSTIIDWKAVLRMFTGCLVRGKRSTSMKRINKRYPYIHPGIKRGYTSKLLIAIDESGSVDDEMLSMFFAELTNLTRKIDVTILHFDCYCDVKDLYEWKKGTCPAIKREKGGGTNFDAPTNLVNKQENHGRWDGMLIATDGQAGKPGPSLIKRGWVLGQGCKLAFPSDEIQIRLTKDKQLSGAWLL